MRSTNSVEIKLFRTNMAILCNFDWVPLPIMYPQLIVLAVHTYFLICVLSRQFIINGYLFSINDRAAIHILHGLAESCRSDIGLTVVDEGYGETPALKKDIFWNDKIEPLYTLESAHDEQPMCGITGSANPRLGTADVHISPTRIAENNREIKMLPLPHDTDPGHTSHPFGLFRRSFQKRFGSKSTAGAENHFGSNVLKSIKQQFPRSLSYSQVHFVTSLSSDDSEESVKPQNDMTMRTLGRTTSHPNYRRSSLTSALEAIVNDSSAYTNLGVIIG
uniref:Bestrophin homolog n=1 Tax=Parascaris equorum TaxID=6256 RepID=A0A914RKJ4_PAREQ